MEVRLIVCRFKCYNKIYIGGADTTVSAEYAFFLAMVLNPGKVISYLTGHAMLTIYCHFRGSEKSPSRD